MSYSLGIDVGTTFVTAALGQGSTTQMVPLGSQSVVTPAVVYLRSDGTIRSGESVGLPAVGGADRVCRELMSRLGDPAPVLLGAQHYEPTAVLGILLHDVVQQATRTQGESPDHIVLTHPAGWGPFRCALLGEAARQAGLAKPGLVTEPEAAVAHYTASRAMREGETVAVYDLGGGTFTVTILRNRSGGMQILGEPATFPVLLPAHALDVRLALNVKDQLRGTMESTIRALSQTLQAAQVEPADLSAVLLVGGSPHIPLVARTMSDELGYPAVVDSDPQYVVALGAARLAAQTAPPPRPTRHAQPAAAVTSAVRQRAARPPIPAPGTPPREAAPRTGTTMLGNDTAGDAVATVPAMAPVAKSPPPPTPPPPLVERPTPRRPHRRAAGAAKTPPVSRRRQPRVLLSTGAAVALTGLIALAVLGGQSASPTATPTAAPPGVPAPAKAEPTAVAEVGTQVVTPAVSATIQVARSPAFVAVSPDGGRAYTANPDTRALTVVDTAVNKVVETIPIAAGPPQFVTFAPDGRTLYISLFNDQLTIHAIGVLDTASNTVIATIPQPGRPYLPALTPDGTRLYVPNHDVAAVSVIDTDTNTVVGEIKVAPNPHWVDFSLDGRRAYTANHESNVVTVIDTDTLRVLKTIPVGTSPHSIAVHPRRPLAAETNFDSDSVSAIDTTTNQVVATIPVGNNPQAIAWAPDGRFAYVVNQGSNTVSVIDAATNRVTATLRTGTGPTSIAVLPDGRRAYVSNLNSATLTVLELPG